MSPRRALLAAPRRPQRAQRVRRSPGPLARPDWPLATDLYELTMADAYLAEGMGARAVFSLFVRELPPQRNFLLACGTEAVLGLLEALRFDAGALAYVRSLGRFSEPLLRWLAGFRFRGDVWGVPEGTPVFAGEPLLEVEGPLPEVQLLETLVVNQVHLQTLLASKAARVVLAAAGRQVVDFGLRRAHGLEAGLAAARASYVAGAAATSNVLAARAYGIPPLGTMAHSYVQAHASERDAFRAFLRRFPHATLLVDTYDTERGVRHAIEVARELGPSHTPVALRLDSGDLLALSRRARALLDEAGLRGVGLFASGGLDEARVRALVEAGAPLDGFGVGTTMDVSEDAPSLDIAYKLVEYAGAPRMKLSSRKAFLPGPKQVFRGPAGDTLAQRGEALPGEPLLAPLMRRGQRLGPAPASLGPARERARTAIAALPPALRGLAPAPHPVAISPALQEAAGRLTRALTRQEAP